MVRLHDGNEDDVLLIDPQLHVVPRFGGEVDDGDLLEHVADLRAGDGLAAAGGVGLVRMPLGGVGGELGAGPPKILVRIGNQRRPTGAADQQGDDDEK